MVAFSNSHGGKLLYAGAGSGVRRALEYDLDVIFSNGVGQREITHSYNEFVITIPHNSEQVTNQGNLVPGFSTSELSANQAHSKSNQPQSRNNQAANSLVTRPLTKKEQNIRNLCSEPELLRKLWIN